MASSPLSEHELIEKLNAEEVTRLAPTMVFMLLISVTGIPGNGFVCYIYRAKYTVSSSRYFIFHLATMDLVICTLIVPIEFSLLFQQYTFTNDTWCKCSAFFTLCAILSLGLTLVVISIDRYRKVCKPLGWQINFRRGRYLCICVIIAALVISAPVFSAYGIHTFQLRGHNVTASECSFRRISNESKFPFVYVVFGMILFICAIATICILYCFIGCKIKQHNNKERAKGHFSLLPRNGNQIGLISLTSSTNMQCRRVECSGNGVNVTTKMITPDPNHECKMEYLVDEADNTSFDNMAEDDTGDHDFDVPIKPITRREKSKSKRMRRARAQKATFSMFLISITFVLSYLPFLSLLLMRSVLNDFDESLSDDGRAVCKFFLRSIFLNCAINPFIYGISDSKFRQSFKHIIRSIFARITQLTQRY